MVRTEALKARDSCVSCFAIMTPSVWRFGIEADEIVHGIDTRNIKRPHS
jgi:hypothetical protein